MPAESGQGTFGGQLLQLRQRRAGKLRRLWKDHRPGHIAGPAPQLTADEVADAAEEQPYRHQRRNEINGIEEMYTMPARPPRHRRQHTEQATMEAHAAFPDPDQ